MAINRDGYKSLVESVNEAVMAGKAPTTTDNTASAKGKGGKQTPTAVSRKGKSASTTSSGNATDNPGWQGGPYGSSDAYDLANILNQMAQGGSSKKSGNAVGVSKSPAAATLSPKNKSSTGKPITEAPKAGGIQSISGRRLQTIRQNHPGMVPTNPNRPTSLPDKLPFDRYGQIPIRLRSRQLDLPGIGTINYKTPELSEDQDWDILDEILAEGLELYGEEGLEEILTSFAVSGEMSQELADLLSDE